jgi:dTDP-4-amino-4,6-dideoxygalactose transaminase
MSSPARSSAMPSRAAPVGVPMFDTRRQYDALRDELTAAIARVCESGRYILGSECEDFERAMADYCGTTHAVSCASGSDALLLALMAIGVGPRDEVLLPSYTFFATASAVWRLGAKPVFIDIDPETFNLDPLLVEGRLTRRTKAILPVHLYGQCAEMTALAAIARRHGLAVIEDAAQAIGAEYDGRRAGALGDIGCFSFYPTKNLGCLGDGGLLTTTAAHLADRLSLLRGHGMRPRYYHQTVGINSRLDAIQAAILSVKLRNLNAWTEARRTNARRYGELLAARGLIGPIVPPAESPRGRHAWNQYVIRVADGRRDALQAHLMSRHIGTEIYYPLPLHQQECFRALGYQPGSLPETERAAAETLALPIFPELTADEQQCVVDGIADFFDTTRAPSSARGHAIPAPKFLGNPHLRNDARR